MKQVLIRQGGAVVEDVPAPHVEAGCVLVRVAHSCISAGTEMSGVRASGVPLWRRALRDPAKVGKVLRMALTEGPGRARAAVRSRISAATAVGYSAAGTVLEVGGGVDDLRVGDVVACAGAQCAHHAEIICVPRNLTVPVPSSLDTRSACTATLGAIALQGVRRAAPTLGETFVVIGMGILGQLAAQLLKANGCKAIGVDLDRGRLALARRLGLDATVHPDDGVDVEQVARLTDGIGADGVIITAATPSNAVVSSAFEMCRRKGRVVLVGDVGLALNRADFYEKEIDFLISTSYGPGRYDRRYEEEGLDYPVGYVRWTENRNLSAYLGLLAAGEVEVGPLISATHDLSEAASAYESLKSAEDRPLIVVLSYPQAGAPQAERVVANPRAAAARGDQVRFAVVGAGAFAKGMHLPNLQALADAHLQAVVDRDGVAAKAAAEQFGAAYATTDFDRVLEDRDVDAVLITTRHHLHAALALGALRAGKHVLVEKPLALTRQELAEIERFFAEAGDAETPLLLVGFNRRFSPYARRLAELTGERAEAMIVDYRMNAGHMPPDHWVHGPEGGGRNLGEACHIYDLFTFLTGSRVERVRADAIRPRTQHAARNDNFVAAFGFEDGSVAALTYTALGSKEHPKEQMEVFVDGKVVVLDDYRTLRVAGARRGALRTRAARKGHREELAAFVEAIRAGGDWPIPLWQLVQATRMALDVEEAVTANGRGSGDA